MCEIGAPKPGSAYLRSLPSSVCVANGTMASQVAAKAAKAIYAQPMFVPKGPINSGRFNLIREIVIGSSLGIALGLVWKVSEDSMHRREAALQQCWQEVVSASLTSNSAPY